MLEVGLQMTISEKVTPQNTAAALGSGGRGVYAAPAMAQLMEKDVLSLRPGRAGGRLYSGRTALDISI